MIKYNVLVLVSIFSFIGIAQEMTPEVLLAKSIAYHDPDTAWESFRGTLSITMETPNSSDRFSDVTLNLPANYFKLSVRKDDTVYEQLLDKGICQLSLNGSENITEEDAKKYRLSCDRTITMKNYYTYLYGLPMKLKDPGTILSPNVETKRFKGKQYLVLKVQYDESVGSDTWYFYFDPKTYAMEVYQFFHNEAENDGEYILLDGIMVIQNMKIPKKRAWYTNKEDRLLGTDILAAFKKLD
jgi:hypothetical protein